MTRPSRPKAAPTLTPAILADAPERAAIEILRVTLDVTTFALFAAHPELLDENWPDLQEPPHPQTWVAHMIATQAHALRRELDRYEQTAPTFEIERQRRARPTGDIVIP